MSKETHFNVKSKNVSITEQEPNKEIISELDTKIFAFLKKTGPITRYDLVKMTGIARSTLYDSLTRLILKGLVKKYSEDIHATKGRPKVFFEAVARNI